MRPSQTLEVFEEQNDQREMYTGERFPIIAEDRVFSEATEQWLDGWLYEDEKANNSELYQQITAFEKSYSRLRGYGPRRESVRWLLVDSFLQKAIARGSDHLSGRTDDEVWFADSVDFCSYLDQVFPISDRDDVTPYQGDPEDDNDTLH